MFIISSSSVIISSSSSCFSRSRQVSHEQRSLLGRVQQLESVTVPDLIARIDGAASALRTVMQDHTLLLKPRFEYRDAVKLLQTAAVCCCVCAQR